MVDFGADKKVSQPAFDAVVGQEDLKTGLLTVATDDSLDGLLIRGEKGTAKSTTVRALADILGEQWVIAECPYGCPPGRPADQCATCRSRSAPVVERRQPPVVTLPLGATRDRVVGTLSVADAMDGDHSFDPGLLARANRGILYVDEVNLLDDHLVDVLLDAAAAGVNRVERDGVTVTHPASFTLVGTMNPEEGDLRPQLRDRFALGTSVGACEAIDDRVTILDRALGDEERPGTPDDGSAAARLATAREYLSDVDLPRSFRERIAEACLDAGVDGHRADIAAARAARALAALDGRTTVLEPDVAEALSFALEHRLASTPFADGPDLSDVLEAEESDGDGDSQQEGNDSESGRGSGDDSGSGTADGASGDGRSEDGGPDESGDGGASTPQPTADDAGDEWTDTADGESDADGDDGPGPDHGSGSSDGPEPQPAEASSGQTGSDGTDTPESGRPLMIGQSAAEPAQASGPDVEQLSVDTGSSASGSADGRGADRGRRVRTKTAASAADADPVASVRAASKRGATVVESRDLRESVREGEAETLVVLALDASASMRPAMAVAKGAVLELLEDADEARDEVAVVTFAGDKADVVLPPTDSVGRAARHLKELPAGDRTPLPAGLRTARGVVDRANPEASVVVVVTDGQTTVADGSPVEATRTAASALADAADRTLLVDTGEDGTAALTDVLVSETDAEVVPLSSLSADRIDRAARQ